MTAEQVHTLCFPAANTIALAAMLATAGGGAEEPNKALSDVTFDAAGSLLEFIQNFYVAVAEIYSIVDKVEPVADLTDAIRAEDVRVPPICYSP
jgi:hypothetical protein